MQPDMQYVNSLAIATHPQHMLLAGIVPNPYRSLDGGVTWVKAQRLPSAGAQFIFAGGDTDHLYLGTGIGLFFSSDAGNTWEQAAGVLGRLQIMALGSAMVDGHTLLYAATNGGNAAVTFSTAAKTPGKARTMASNLVEAGIYRYVQYSYTPTPTRTPSAIATLTPTPTKIPTVVTLRSTGAYDGFVLESSEASNKGGTINNTAATFNLGDDKTKKQYRAILSFNTAANLPANAIITRITLKVKQQGIVGGGNPLTIFQGFMVDIKKGFFGTTPVLQTTDFQAPASKSYGPFKPAPVGKWYSIDLTSAKNYINQLSTASGLTQIRLRFRLDDNNNALANYLSLVSGNALATTNRPQLMITYYVP
jgi:hypothetical protein